jgi:hypothetical protein
MAPPPTIRGSAVRLATFDACHEPTYAKLSITALLALALVGLVTGVERPNCQES